MPIKTLWRIASIEYQACVYFSGALKIWDNLAWTYGNVSCTKKHIPKITSAIIYTFDNSFVFGEVGPGVAGIYIKDDNYKDVIHISYIDKYDLIIDTYKVDESGIEFTASKMYDNVLPTPEGGDTIDTCAKFEKYKETYVYGKFKYSYDKSNNKFNDYEIIELKQLNDIEKFSSLCK